MTKNRSFLSEWRTKWAEYSCVSSWDIEKICYKQGTFQVCHHRSSPWYMFEVEKANDLESRQLTVIIALTQIGNRQSKAMGKGFHYLCLKVYDLRQIVMCELESRQKHKNADQSQDLNKLVKIDRQKLESEMTKWIKSNRLKDEISSDTFSKCNPIGINQCKRYRDLILKVKVFEGLYFIVPMYKRCATFLPGSSDYVLRVFYEDGRVVVSNNANDGDDDGDVSPDVVKDETLRFDYVSGG